MPGIIDPDGYFGGDRFDLISDEARVVWPSFFLASNTLGRIELNYAKVIAAAFSRWKKKPTEKLFWSYVDEYREAFLLFVYEVDGRIWGQWDTPEKFLPRHQLTADKRTPPPLAREYLDWRNEYIKAKSAKSNIPEHFKILRKVSQNSANLRTELQGIGVVEGIGGGEVKELYAAEAAEPPKETPPAKPHLVKSGTPSRFSEPSLPEAWSKHAADKHGWNAELIGEIFSAFSDYWIAKPKDATKNDWFATWRTWCRNESKQGPAARGHPLFQQKSDPRIAKLQEWAER